MSHKTNCCKECEWWKDEDAEVGSCRRKSPIPHGLISNEIHITEVDMGVWPFTEAEDWCGEFLSKV